MDTPHALPHQPAPQALPEDRTLLTHNDRHRARRNRPSKRLLVPTAFDITRHPELKETGLHASTLWFLHELVKGTQRRKSEDKKYPIPMSAEFLTKVIHHRALPKIISVLEKAGIIGVQPYIPPSIGGKGGRCRCFWFKVQSPIKAVWIDYAPVVRKMNLLELERKPMAGLTKDEVTDHLATWLEKAEIAKTYVPVMEPILEGECKGQLDNSDAVKVEAMANGELYLTQDDYGRVHTNITSLRCECREHLTIGGANLVSIDIRNSQPLFFAMTYKQARGDQDWFDQDFVTLCEEGRLYDELCQMASCSRADAKHEVLATILYGKRIPANCAPVVDCFRDKWPDVWDFIMDRKHANYKALAHEMQQAESQLMIEDVCGHLAKHHPEIPVLTIHDSIMTTPDHADYVQGVIEKQFAYRGMNATLKVE